MRTLYADAAIQAITVNDWEKEAIRPVVISGVRLNALTLLFSPLLKWVSSPWLPRWRAFCLRDGCVGELMQKQDAGCHDDSGSDRVTDHTDLHKRDCEADEEKRGLGACPDVPVCNTHLEPRAGELETRASVRSLTLHQPRA